MRTDGQKPRGMGLWQVKMMPARPRFRACSAYSSGSPRACLHNGVCMWESK